jgi:hypothetical protein
MALTNQKLNAGLLGGNKVLRGYQSVTSSYTGNFIGIRIVNASKFVSILNEYNINTTGSLYVNDILTSITSSTILAPGDIITPANYTGCFKGLTFKSYSNFQQIIAYNTGSL